MIWREAEESRLWYVRIQCEAGSLVGTINLRIIAQVILKSLDKDFYRQRCACYIARKKVHDIISRCLPDCPPFRAPNVH